MITVTNVALTLNVFLEILNVCTADWSVSLLRLVWSCAPTSMLEQLVILVEGHSVELLIGELSGWPPDSSKIQQTG